MLILKIRYSIYLSLKFMLMKFLVVSIVFTFFKNCFKSYQLKLLIEKVIWGQSILLNNPVYSHNKIIAWYLIIKTLSTFIVYSIFYLSIISLLSFKKVSKSSKSF